MIVSDFELFEVAEGRKGRDFLHEVEVVDFFVVEGEKFVFLGEGGILPGVAMRCLLVDLFGDGYFGDGLFEGKVGEVLGQCLRVGEE